MKAKLNGKAEVNPGSAAEARADRQINIKKAWDKVIMASALTTYAVLTPATGKVGKPGKLTLTSKQRSVLVSRLKKIREKRSANVNIGAPELAAQQLKKFLLDKWRSSDEK